MSTECTEELIAALSACVATLKGECVSFQSGSFASMQDQKDAVLRMADTAMTQAATRGCTIIRGNIQSLIDAFPSLRKRKVVWPGNSGPQFTRQLREMSSGEYLCGLFVMHVWNKSKFDFGRAMTVWDEGNMAAFKAWVMDRWYC